MKHMKINRILSIAIITCLVITSTPLQAIAEEINESRQHQETITTFEGDQNKNSIDIVSTTPKAVDIPDVTTTTQRRVLNEAKYDGILVKYKNEKILKDNLKAQFKSSNLTTKKQFRNSKMDLLKVDKSADINSVIQELEKDPNVEYAQPNYEIQMLDDLSSENGEGLLSVYEIGEVIEGQECIPGTAINVLPAWELTKGSLDIIIGVIDTGIDISHNELQNNIFINQNEIANDGIDNDGNGYIDDLNGWDFVNFDNSVYDTGDETHGTHISGIIAADENGEGVCGVAPQAKILPIKFTNGSTSYTSDAIEAIGYAENMGARIVNCSWGGYDYNTALRDVISSSNMLFVCAAGNDDSTEAVYPASFDLPNVIGVGAVNPDGDKASFSNYGENVDLAAPGVSIISTLPQNKYGYAGGTSMAAGFVSGVAALMLSYQPNLSAGQAVARLKSSVSMNENSHVFTNTSGIVDAYAALINKNTVDNNENEETAAESNLVYNILSSIESISQATIEQTEEICNFYNITEQQITEAEEGGYSLYDSINIAKASREYSFTVAEVISLLQIYGSYLDAESELSKFKRFTERYLITEQDYNEVKDAFLEGYNTYDVRSAYVASQVSNLNFNSMLKDSNEGSLQTILNSLNIQLSQDDIDMLETLFEEYGICKTAFLTYIQQNSISVEQIVSMFEQCEEDILTQYNDETGQTVNLYEEGEDGEINTEKYFNAPCINNINDSENINLNTGSLMYESTDLSLKGRNGLDLNITTRYNSSQAKLYSEKHKINNIYHYRVKKQEVEYIRYNNGRTVITRTMPWRTAGTYESYRDAKLYAQIYDGWTLPISPVYNDVKSTKYFQKSTQSTVTYTRYPDSPIEYQDPSFVYVPSSEFVSGDGYYGSIRHQYDRVIRDTGYVASPYSWYPVTKYKYVRKVTFEHIYEGYLSKTTTVKVGDKFTRDSVYVESYLADTDYINETSESTYNEHHNGLGSGWELGFSSLEIDGSDKYLHLSNGEIYKVNITSTVGDSNLDKYLLSDIRFENDSGSYSNRVKTSQYALIHKDGLKEYFADDGRLLGLQDRFGNSIKFEHSMIDEFPVITRITDTVGRTVEIAYQTTENGKEVTVTAPDASVIRYILEPIPGCTGEYRLSKKIDSLNRETDFSYDVDSCQFTFFAKEGRDTENKYANLTEIHYPSGAYSKYTYEKTVGNMGNQGSTEYFRVKTRQDIDNGKSYNKKTYDYIGNYTGYPTCNDPNSLSSDFTYGVNVSDVYLTKVSYIFNNKHLKSSEEIKEKGTILKERTEYEYDVNKLPTKSVNKTYNNITGQYMEKVENYIYDPNNLGDVVEYWDSQNNRDANKLPTDNEHRTTYTYNSSYHYMTSKTYKKDADTTIYEEKVPCSDNKSIEWERVYENGVLKEQTQNTYDMYGNIAEERKYLGNWADYITNKYSYSDNDAARNGQFDGVYLTRKWTEDVKNADENMVDAKAGNNAGVVDEVNQYDIMGNLTEKQDGKGYRTSYQYDSCGRLLTETYADGSHKELNYNDAENSIVSTNENGDSIKFVYDGFGNLLKKQDVESGEILEQHEYDLEFKPVKEISNNNESITSYSYTDDGRLLSKTIIDGDDTLLHAESYIYENASNAGAYNKITKIIEGDENSPSVITTSYENKFGHIEKEGKMHDGMEYLETYKYDYLGNKTEEKSARAYDENWTESYTKKYQYNYKGDIMKESNIFGDCITHEYDSLGRVKKITDMKGNKAAATYFTTYEYDNLDRLIKEIVPFEEVGGTIYYTTKKHYYDQNKNIIRECVTINKPEEAETYSRMDFEYNNRNKLAKVTTYNDEVPENYTQFYYDAAGNKVRMYTGLSDPLTISGLDSVASNGDSEYSVTQYGYDRFGNLTSIIDALGNEETYNYDFNGNKVQQIDRNGNIISIDYDGMGRVLQKSVTTPDSLGSKSYSYTYTLTGNLLSSSGDSVNTNYTYDDLGNKITESMTNGITKEYGYDAGGNKTSFILKQSDVAQSDTAYRYDKMNRLEQVSEDGQSKATYTYDDNGNRKTLTYSNGNITVYQYNLANKLKSLTNSNNAITLSEYSYNYYLDGNQACKNENLKNKVTEYLYDGLGRLESETEKESGSSVSAIAYTYDDYNNRATMTKDGAETSYDYDLNSRLKAETVVSGDITEITSYGYDNNGNQTSKATETIKPQKPGDTMSLSVSQLGVDGDEKVSLNEYDGFNQLVKVISGHTTATYEYNGDGLRSNKTVNGINITHIWDGKQMSMELSSQGAIVNRYLRGTNLISAEDGAGTESYYLYNGHGDVVQLADRAGTVTKTYNYDAFGVEKNPDTEDTNVFRYSGQYFDMEIGTYYLQARYYDPVIGRFISADSYLGKDNDPLSLNLYTYCNNNPIMYVDEDGHLPILAVIAIGAFVGAAFDIGMQMYFENRRFSEIDKSSVFKSALVGGIGAGVSLGIGALGSTAYGLGRATYGLGATSRYGYGVGSSMLSGAITNTIGDSFIYKRINTPMDFVNSAGVGALGGSFGYGASRFGGNLYKNGIFNNMSRNAQRSFMRSNFNIRTNISGAIRYSSQNNSIANYYSNNSWVIGGFSEIFSNAGTEVGNNYVPGINSNLYNSWNRLYTNSWYSYPYYR